MKIHKGTARICIVIPWLGIAIKIAKLKPITFLRSALKCKSWRMRRYLFRACFNGCLENWNELVRSERFGHPLLCPVYFSIVLVSIQRYEPELIEVGPTRFSQMSLLTEGHVWDSVHSFANKGNWAIGSDGKLVMIDYGAAAIADVLRRYGDNLWRNFNTERDMTQADHEMISRLECAWSEKRKQGRAR